MPSLPLIRKRACQYGALAGIHGGKEIAKGICKGFYAFGFQLLRDIAQLNAEGYKCLQGGRPDCALRQRQRDGEATALAGCALHAHPAAVKHGQALA